MDPAVRAPRASSRTSASTASRRTPTSPGRSSTSATGRRSGPARQGLRERRRRRSIALPDDRRPADADLPQRRLSRRRAADLGRARREGQGRRGGRQDQVRASCSAASRATRSSRAGTRSSCRFGGEFFDDKWNVTFNSAEGKAAADFFVTHAEVDRAARRRRVRLRPGGRGDPGRRGGAIIQYTGNASSRTTRSSRRRSASSTSPSCRRRSRRSPRSASSSTASRRRRRTRTTRSRS